MKEITVKPIQSIRDDSFLEAHLHYNVCFPHTGVQVLFTNLKHAEAFCVKTNRFIEDTLFKLNRTFIQIISWHRNMWPYYSIYNKKVKAEYDESLQVDYSIASIMNDDFGRFQRFCDVEKDSYTQLWSMIIRITLKQIKILNFLYKVYEHRKLKIELAEIDDKIIQLERMHTDYIYWGTTEAKTIIAITHPLRKDEYNAILANNEKKYNESLMRKAEREMKENQKAAKQKAALKKGLNQA